MFDRGSRYYELGHRSFTVTGPDGQPREIRYVERRFVPPADEGTTIIEHLVVRGDRLDNIAAAYMGDPTQFWRICDANGVMDPNELAETVGRRIRVAVSGI